MRTAVLVYYLCLLIHTVVQKSTGQRKEPHLFHKNLNEISKNSTNMSENAIEVYNTRMSNHKSKRSQSNDLSHGKKFTGKHLSIPKHNTQENAEEKKHRSSTEDYNDLSFSKHQPENAIRNMESETTRNNSNTNNNEGLDRYNKQRFKANVSDDGLHWMRTRRGVNKGSRAGGTTDQNRRIYSASSPSELGLSDTVQQLVMEMKKLHKQQDLDRKMYQSLQQHFFTIKNDHGKIEESVKQLKSIQLVVRSFDVETKITRKEISTIKNNQQRFLKRLDAISRRNQNLANKVHRISAICEERLFSLPQINESESKVINSTIKVIGGGSREIKDEMKKLKENIQAAHLMIDFQAKVSTVLESKINKTLLVLQYIQRNVSRAHDLIMSGQIGRAAQVSASLNSSGKKVSTKTNSEFNDEPDKGYNLEGQKRNERKLRKARQSLSLALIMSRSERNVDDSSKRNNEEMTSQDNKAQYKPVHAHGVSRTRFGANGDTRVNIVDDVQKESSQSRSLASHELGVILLQGAGPMLPSSCCPHLDEQVRLSSTVEELQSVRDKLSETSTFIDSRWPSFHSSSMDDQFHTLLSTDKQISEMKPTSVLYDTESTQLFDKNLKDALLSHSAATLQRTLLNNKTHHSLDTSSQKVSILSSATESPTLLQTSFLLEASNFAPSPFEIKNDQSTKKDDLDSSSDTLDLSTGKNGTNLTSLVDAKREDTPSADWAITDDRDSKRPKTFDIKDELNTAVDNIDLSSYWFELSTWKYGMGLASLGDVKKEGEGTSSVVWAITEDSDSKWPKPFEMTLSYLSASEIHLHSLAPALGNDTFNAHDVSSTLHEARISSDSNLQAPGNILSSSSVSNNELGLTSHTSHLLPTGVRTSSLYGSYSNKPELLTYFDQIFISSFTTIESMESFVSLEPFTSLWPSKALEPSTSWKQLTSLKLSKALQPSVSLEPSTSWQPLTSLVPSKALQPSVSLESSTSWESLTSLEPSKAWQPSVSLEPSTSWEPLTSSEPSKAWQPSVSLEPSTSWEPLTSLEPSNAWQPSVSLEPSTSWEPSTSSEPSKALDSSVSWKPSTDVGPSTYLEPFASLESFVSLKPSTSAEAKTQIPGLSDSEQDILQISSLASGKQSVGSPPYHQTDPSSRILVSSEVNTDSPITYWSLSKQTSLVENLQDETQLRTDRNSNAATNSPFSHKVMSEDSTKFDQFSFTSGEFETVGVDISTPGIDWSDVEPSLHTGKLHGAMQAGTGTNDATSSSYANTDISEDSTKLDPSRVSETIKVDISTLGIDLSDVEQSSHTKQLSVRIPIGEQENENSSSQSKYAVNLDQIYPSPSRFEKLDTTPVMYWPDVQMSSLREEMEGDILTDTQGTIDIMNHLKVSHLAESEGATNLDFTDSSSPTVKTINVVITSNVIDGRDTGRSFPDVNLPELLPTQMDTGQYTLQSDHYLHLVDISSSLASSTGHQNPITLSVSNAGRSTDGPHNITATGAEADKTLCSSKSDFSSMQLNTGSSSDEIQIGPTLDTSTITSIIDWTVGASSRHMRDGLPSITEDSDKNVNSPLDSQFAQFKSVSVKTEGTHFDSDTFLTLEILRPHRTTAAVLEVFTSLIPEMSWVDPDSSVAPEISWVNAITSATPEIYTATSFTAWPEAHSLSSKDNLLAIMPTAVKEDSHLVTYSIHLNGTTTGKDTSGTSDINIPQDQNHLPPSPPLGNTSVLPEPEQIQSFDRNQTDTMSSESNSSQNQTSDEVYTGYIRHLEERLNVLETSMIHLTSGRMLHSQDANSHLLNKTIDAQADLEVDSQNRKSDLMWQLVRDILIVQNQHDDLKKKLAKQQVYVQNETSHVMIELERQRNESNHLKKEVEQQNKYIHDQLEGVKREQDRQKVEHQNHAMEFMQKLSEQNVYIQNKTQSLEERLQAEAANVELVRKVAARSSMMGIYLARKVSAINMTEFTSRLHESLHNFTKNVLTQDQWRNSHQQIVDASLDNQAKISQIQTMLKDTAHSVTKLQGRVRNVHLIGERWYKSLQGHLIRLNNTVQDLREKAIQPADVRDQTVDFRPIGNSLIQKRVDSLHVQLLYNANRLSSLEASMLNLSLAQCRRSSEDVSQVNALDLNTFKVQSSMKTAEKAVSSLRGSMTSLMSVAPGIQTLREQMENVLSMIPTDCHEYSRRGHSESGVYIIYPKRLNRTVRVYCVMEDNHKSTCSSYTSTSSGFPRSIDTNNDSLSDVADKNNLDKDNIDIKFSTGWTVIQRRKTGRLNFTRSWEEYVGGFGVADEEYWAGNEVIHSLTTQKDCSLRFIMEDMSSMKWEATYSQFKLAGKEHNYRIHLSGYFGNVSDGMIRCNASAFSTVDFDNDSSSSHCALYNGGGWWYSQCHVTNLNGPYNIGMVWFSSDKQDWIQMKSSVMMIRPKI